MTNIYSKKFKITENDIDINKHLRDSTYIDYANKTKWSFFEDNGILEIFKKENIGPIAFEIKIEFKKEIFLNEEITVTQWLDYFSNDHRKWRLINQIYKEDGNISAIITTFGSYLNLNKRKVVSPPKVIREIMERKLIN